MGLLELTRRVSVMGVAAFAVSLAGAQAPANPLSYRRAVSYTSDPVTGQLVTETVEPDAANVSLCLLTTYGRDAYGNVNSVTQSNCAGTVPTRQQITTRTNSLKFAPASPVSVMVNGTSVTLPQGMFAQELQNALTRETTQQFESVLARQATV